MMLLPLCICGETAFELEERGGLTLAVCACGVKRSATQETRAQYEAQYRSGDYHASSARHAGCVPYGARYFHDYGIAGVRWQRYFELLGEKFLRVYRLLDVGCANGAFVDYALRHGVEAYGVDPNPAMERMPHIFGQALREFESPLAFALVTFHDVLEHMIEPDDALEWAAALLDQRGLVIIDVPDVSVPEGAHHYKAEHLWYFTPASLGMILADAGFEVIEIDRPIAGKLVVYGERKC